MNMKRIIEKQDEYICLLENAYKKAVPFLSVHNWKDDAKDVENGHEQTHER